MQTLKPQIPDFHTLQEDLDLRPSHQLTEAEVNDFLQQVLPQLEWLHNQGKSHGSISLDTLAFYEGKIRLLEGNSEPQGFPDSSRDIADLGQVVLQMLTGKPAESLRDAYGNWNWEDECLVTDHLAGVINQMIGNTGQPLPRSAQHVLSMLNQQNQPLDLIIPQDQPMAGVSQIPAKFYTQTVTNPVRSSEPSAYPGKGSQQDSRKPKFKLKTWQWATLGSLCGLGILSAVALPTFFNQEVKAKQYEATSNLGSFGREQQAYFLEHYSFSTEGWEELEQYLRSNIRESQLYIFDSYNPTDTQVIGTASAREDGLRSYSIINYLVQSADGQITSFVAMCETDKPTRVPPQAIQLFEQGGTCPLGSSLAQGNFELGSGYRILRALPNSQVTEAPDENPTNPSLVNSPQQSLAQDQAVDLVRQWLSAKPRIFGPPFDKNLLGQLTTGNTYRDNLGSIEWLQGNGYRYSYSASRIDNVWSFVTSNTTPSIKVSIYEDLTLHGPRGIDRSKSGASKRNFIYYFSRDVDGEWKVSDYRRAE
jgi:type II secretory pathway pseudopilin PulG